MFVDNTKSYPLTIWLSLTFNKHLDRECITKAIEVLHARQPMLRAKIVGSIHDYTSQLSWMDHHIPPDIVWLNSLEMPTKLSGSPLDLRSRNGIRFLLTNNEDYTKLWIQANHACCDGVAFHHISQELAYIYNAIYNSAQDHVPLAPVDESLLKYRDRFHRNLYTRAFSPMTYPWQLIRYGLKKREPIALPKDRTNNIGEFNRGPCLDSQVISKELVTTLRKHCRRLNITLNDLLLQKWLITLQQWNHRYSNSRPSSMALLMPVDMRNMNLRFRRASHSSPGSIPICSLTGYGFIQPPTSKYASPGDLLSYINHYTSHIKKFGYPFIFNDGVRFVSKFRDGLYKSLQANFCYATAVMSNVGIFFKNSPFADQEGFVRFGDARLMKIEGIAPTRALTYASCTVITYAGNLCVVVLVDPWLLIESDAAYLLETFLGLLAEEAQIK